jgi:DNA repair protein RadD
LLTGGTPSAERKDLVAAFKAGRVRCLVGCDVFSTGFDAPAVDLIAIVRPTASPVWHVQSAGRGTRRAPGKNDCLILDFAGNFSRLGPIDAPHVRAKGERTRNNDDAPLTRSCPSCDGIIAARSRSCPLCNTSLETKARRTELSTCAAGHAIIIGSGVFPVYGVHYTAHHKSGRPDSVRLQYRIGGFSFPTISEWLTCWHGGHAGAQARHEWRRRLKPGASYQIPRDAAQAVVVAPSWLQPPSHVRITRRGEFMQAIPLFVDVTGKVVA